MSHVLTYPTHRAKHAAVVGSEYIHDLALSDLCIGAVSYDLSTRSLSSVVAQNFLGDVPALHLRNATHYLSSHDIPTLERALRVCDRIVLSGSHWSDVDVMEWWGRSSSNRKIFDISKMTTKTARRLLEQWVQAVSGMSPAMSTFACERVRFDPALAVPLARKAAVFDGNLTASDVETLARDFYTEDFVEHLLQMRTRDAVRVAQTMDAAQCKAALSQALHALPMMARINAAVLAYPAPSGEASRTTRLPITTLAKYWQVAGRYGPQEVLYRLDLLRYLTESSPRDYSSLTSLVAMW